jgi:hypothetical protein
LPTHPIIGRKQRRIEKCRHVRARPIFAQLAP